LIKNTLPSAKHPGYILIQSLKFEYIAEASQVVVKVTPMHQGIHFLGKFLKS